MKKLTSDQFIEKAKNIHGNKYYYDKIVYTTNKIKVTITCQVHGDFEQSPNAHLQGKGCSHCGNSLPHTTTTFIEKARHIHNNAYSYSKVHYVNNATKVIITCPIHGDFTQKPAQHLDGHKCVKCATISRSNKRSHKDGFIAKASTVHNNKYTYTDSKYVNANTKIAITCPIHGNFAQIPATHLQGMGCSSCGNKRASGNGWSYTVWEKSGKSSKVFEGFSFYILECWNSTEKFYKIGKTFTGITKRYGSKQRLPYEWKLVYQEYGSARYISEFETLQKYKLQKYTYRPLISFGGHHECFTKIPLKEFYGNADKSRIQTYQ